MFACSSPLFTLLSVIDNGDQHPATVGGKLAGRRLAKQRYLLLAGRRLKLVLFHTVCEGADFGAVADNERAHVAIA